MENKKMRRIGQELQKELEGYYNTKVEIGYVNPDSIDTGFIVYLYANKFDYKKIELNYLSCLEISGYLESIKYALIHDEFKIHIASLEEKYIINILREKNLHNIYVLDGCLYGDEYEIGLNDVDYFAYDKMNNLLEIWSCEEKFEIDLDNETIEFLNEDNAEPITIEFINKIIVAWNKLNYWCSLALRDNSIFLIDKEYKNKTNIVNIDNIDELSLKNNQVFISFRKSDEYNFNCCSINRYGIEY